MQWLIEPWTWGAWMWRGTLAAGLASIACASLGVFLYLRRKSLVADALAHVALPGIVVAALVTGSLGPAPMLLGAGVVGLASALAIERLGQVPRVRSDAAIGIVFTALFALGIILVSTVTRDMHIDAQCVLFGDVLAISDHSLILLGVVTPLVLLLVGVFYRWLAVTSFDPVLAASLGVPVAAVHYGLMASVSVTTVASFEAVGAVLVIALIITPAATAHLLTDRLPTMLAVAIAHGLLSTLIGMYAAVALNCSAGGAMVVVGSLLYVLAFVFAPRHGVFARRAR